MAHRWSFFRAGGVDQVGLRTAADLAALADLDPKLWVALAMPTRDVDVDARTLALLDGDGDGRIRVADLRAAIGWVERTWQDPGELFDGGDSLPIAAIKDARVAAAARRVLAMLGKAGGAVALADAVEATRQLGDTTLNGDGVITPATAEDDDTRRAIEDAIATVGSVADRSGKPGIDAALAARFFEAVDAHAAWLADGDAARPLGDATEAAADATAAIRAKLEDWFARSQLAGFDPRAGALLAGTDAELTALAGEALTRDAAAIARLPLAPVAPGAALRLAAPVNPAWAGRLAAFVERAVAPIRGPRDELTPADVEAVVAALAPFEAWRARRPESPVEALAEERLRALAGGPARARIEERIAADLALADEFAGLASVEKALRFQRDLARVLHNFVNFADFYTKQDAVFQAGTLYLDGRAFRLCVAVTDAGKHATLAGMSDAFLVYCDVARGADRKQVVAAVTNGDGDHLFVGRNGVFYDRDGRDWDATITKIVTNPIGVRQAFWAPYKKLVRMIEERIAKRAADAEAAADARLDHAAARVGAADQAAAAPATAKGPAKIDVGTVAALGVAIGGIGALVIGVLTMFLGLGWWMPVGVLALLFTISGPSMLLAWMKLRKRTLGPLLDANGWAINGRARINVAFGAALTDLAALPPGAARSLDDPYADRRPPWRLYTLLAATLLIAGTWYAGKLDRWLPRAVKSTTVLGADAPAAQTTPLIP